MSYKWTMTPEGKALVRVHHTFSEKNTISEKIKDRACKIYAKMVDGSIRRLAPLKPWRGKSERRRVLSSRRAERLVLQLEDTPGNRATTMPLNAALNGAERKP